jgi:hypothetical protein
MREYSFEEIKSFCAGKKVLVVACEAGASQILASMMLRLNVSNVRYILEGPAIGIFEKKLGALILESLTEDLVETCDLVITGTSLVPDLERRAIKLSQRIGVKVCSVIDHWVNYRQRFTAVGGGWGDAMFPDETWVCDEQAIAAAVREGLPEEHLRKIENYYFTGLQGKTWPTEPGRILYVCEPVFDDVKLLTGNGNAWGYNEFELVSDFLKNLEKMDGVFKKAIVRLHPNESQDKYDALMAEYTGQIPVEISSVEIRSIEEDCSRAEVIVGVESMALVIGLHFGKKVFSCLPENIKKKCHLPHQEIQHIRSVSEIGAVVKDIR